MWLWQPCVPVLLPRTAAPHAAPRHRPAAASHRRKQRNEQEGVGTTVSRLEQANTTSGSKPGNGKEVEVPVVLGVCSMSVERQRRGVPLNSRLVI